jgi:hypothetical protein
MKIICPKCLHHIPHNTDQERFWNFVDRSGDCWVWVSRVDDGGYATFSVNGGNVRASRFMWELVNGSIPDGMFICHKCDNRTCVNPDHLFLGTPADNARDRDSKGRSRRGEKHNLAVLTEEQVKAIRDEYIPGEVGYGKLSRKYGVDKGTIAYVVKGKSWRHLLPGASKLVDVSLSIPTRSQNRGKGGKKLTPEQEELARQEYTSGVSQRQLCIRYGVSMRTMAKCLGKPYAVSSPSCSTTLSLPSI